MSFSGTRSVWMSMWLDVLRNGFRSTTSGDNLLRNVRNVLSHAVRTHYASDCTLTVRAVHQHRTVRFARRVPGYLTVIRRRLVRQLPADSLETVRMSDGDGGHRVDSGGPCREMSN